MKFISALFLIFFSAHSFSQILNLTCQVKGRDSENNGQYGGFDVEIGPTVVSVYVENNHKILFIDIKGIEPFGTVFVYDKYNKDNTSGVFGSDLIKVVDNGKKLRKSVEIDRKKGVISVKTIFIYHPGAILRVNYSGVCNLAKVNKF